MLTHYKLQELVGSENVNRAKSQARKHYETYGVAQGLAHLQATLNKYAELAHMEIGEVDHKNHTIEISSSGYENLSDEGQVAIGQALASHYRQLDSGVASLTGLQSDFYIREATDGTSPHTDYLAEMFPLFVRYAIKLWVQDIKEVSDGDIYLYTLAKGLRFDEYGTLLL